MKGNEDWKGRVAARLDLSWTQFRQISYQSEQPKEKKEEFRELNELTKRMVSLHMRLEVASEWELLITLCAIEWLVA